MEKYMNKSPVKRELARHEAHMYRLLAEILDDKYLAAHAFFKGGTCARMLGFLDRFSVDLDFDLSASANKEKCRKNLHGIFKFLNLEIRDESGEALQFFLKYEAPGEERNIIKLEILDKMFAANEYKPRYLSPIGRTAVCQTIETMFANKLVAPLSRYGGNESIAGRDIYDIHYFFLNSYGYRKEVIEERSGVSISQHLRELREFIAEKVTDRILNEDLNVLLEPEKFQIIRKHLKQETLNFLEAEIERVKKEEKRGNK